VTRRLWIGLLFSLCTPLLLACSRAPQDSTPEGVVRLWLEKMETAENDPRAMKEAYGLMGPKARANLKERAERASKGQGRRYEPYEMLAEGRFGLRFRPRTMTTHIDGDDAVVDVNGEGADERAQVKCTREAQLWRIEPEIPEAIVPTRHLDGGL
jgi:hypothetical protein